MLRGRHPVSSLAIGLITTLAALVHADEPAPKGAQREFGIAAGPMVTLVTGEFDYFTQVTGGFRITGGFRVHERLEALVSFDWSSAHKRHLSRDDGLVFYGVHGGLRYRVPTSRGFSMFLEALAGSQFTRLATGSDVFTENGFGGRLGLGAIVPIGGDFSVVPMVGYSVGFLDDPDGDTATLNQFLGEVSIRWDL